MLVNLPPIVTEFLEASDARNVDRIVTLFAAWDLPSSGHSYYP